MRKQWLNRSHNTFPNYQLWDDLQSAYRPGHSCETAKVKVTNDILLAFDQGEGVLMVMLDLSAAYDLVDHEILLSRLKGNIGLAGTVISWFQSYLEVRTQMVSIADYQSCAMPLNTGIPQGSVLGPLLYLTYMLPVRQILDRYNLSYHGFADDTQIYVPFSFHNGGLKKSLNQLEQCITELREWFHHSRLMLNVNKTEFVVFTSPQNQGKIDMEKCVLTVGEEKIFPSKCVRNLGSFLDMFLHMDEHISKVRKSIYDQLHTVSKIRKYLDPRSCATVINSLVTSRLDYHNALLFGLPESSLRRLQAVQNHAARLLTKTKYNDHITPVLKSLHWLPWIKYKILVFVFKCVHGEPSPKYLRQLIQKHDSGRRLRSSEDVTLLHIPRSKKRFGDRAFAISAPRLCNDLPENLRNVESLYSFKRQLKTHLFKNYFTE